MACNGVLATFAAVTHPSRTLRSVTTEINPLHENITHEDNRTNISVGVEWPQSDDEKLTFYTYVGHTMPSYD